MPDSLVDLESRRSAVQLQIAQLGDLRSGSITGTGGRCGNPNCHCHQAGDPSHGPYYRLTRKVNGKTVTETFSTAAGLAKARREVAECQRFRELGDQLLDVNEQICELRPVEEISPTTQEKKRLKRSKRKSRAKETSCCASSLAVAVSRGTWIWRPSRWLCARPCTTPGQPRRAHCCNSRRGPRSSTPYLVLARVALL